MNSRSKGKRGELELRDVMREEGFGGTRRGQQFSGLGQADVVGGPDGWHFECKRVEALNVWAAYEQAKRDAKAGEVPTVAMRRNKGPWLAVVDLRKLLRMIRDGSAHEILGRSREQALDELCG